MRCLRVDWAVPARELAAWHADARQIGFEPAKAEFVLRNGPGREFTRRT